MMMMTENLGKRPPTCIKIEFKNTDGGAIFYVIFSYIMFV